MSAKTAIIEGIKFVIAQVVCVGIAEGIGFGVNRFSERYNRRRTGSNKPDKRFTKRGPTKKDGTVDMRYKINWPKNYKC